MPNLQPKVPVNTPPRPATRKRSGRLGFTLLQYTQALGDFAAFCLGPLVAAGLLWLAADNLQPYFPAQNRPTLTWLHLALAGGAVGWFWIRLRHYTYRKTFWAELGEILRVVAVCSLVQLVVIALLKMQPSRYAWVLTWAATLVLVPAVRFGLKRILAALNVWQKASVIIGTGPNATDAYKALSHEKNMGFKFKYFVSPRPTTQTTLHGVPVICDETTLWANTKPKNTHYFIALETADITKRDHWIKQTTINGCTAVSVIPTTRGLPLNSLDASFIFSHDVLILRISENLGKVSARIIKRTFDIIGSASLLLLLSPLFAYLWLRIKQDGGRPIYGHERIGRDGQPFKCLKFRSMVLNSQEVLEHLLATNPEARAEWETDFKLKDDPRITPIGHFLRRSSLDELPQLWNVLRGDMSLVGPRPVVEAELDRYGDNVDYYLMAKPGMTGLWQVSGRNDVDYDTRVYFDAWYVKNWSVWHDIAILFKTVGVVLNRSGAY